jgi:hypothetical protein
MDNSLFEHTKVVSYFLWEYTGCDHALELWYCAEDIACYFEQMGILSDQRVAAVRQLGVYDPAYIHFLRHVAFRIYIYTNQPEPNTNWFIAELLLNNREWVTALVGMATIYKNEKTNQDFIRGVRSENVRAYYDGCCIN